MAKHKYKKAGVLLQNLGKRRLVQHSLFDERDHAGIDRLMGAMDRINSEYGRNSIRLGSASPLTLSPCRTWHLRSNHRSPRYTTRWEELPVVIGRGGGWS